MPYKSRIYSSRQSGIHSRGNSYRGGRRAFSAPRNTGRRGPKKDYIDPSRFVKSARPQTEEAYAPTNSFADFKFNPTLQANIAAKGFIVPSPIQDKAIPLGLAGRDVIGIADTGTGKTAAFAIPILESLMLSDQHVLVVAPTRELAQQIDLEFRAIGKGSNLHGAVLIGGSSMTRQLRELRFNPQIVIGTPGRIKDHLQRGSLKLHNFEFIVLDEVDRMLDMGFVNDVRNILSALPEKRQSFFFSATLDARVQSLIQSFAIDPVMVSVKTGDTGENIHQDIVRVGHVSEKLSKLHDILIAGDITKVLIFDDTQRSVERLSNELVARGFSADAIHGGKSQGQRKRALDKFKTNQISILVATDVAARGIDVKDISHVINYSTPQTYDDYVHRIGRTGRAGQTGYALTFVSE